MTRIISAPSDFIIASSDGIDVRFAGIEPTFRFPVGVSPETGSGGITVYIEGVKSRETFGRDNQHLEEIEQ